MVNCLSSKVHSLIISVVRDLNPANVIAPVVLPARANRMIFCDPALVTEAVYCDFFYPDLQPNPNSHNAGPGFWGISIP